MGKVDDGEYPPVTYIGFDVISRRLGFIETYS